MTKFLTMLLLAAGVGALVYSEMPSLQRELKILKM